MATGPLNAAALRVADELAKRDDVTVTSASGARIIDATRGNLDAGLLLARICLADGGDVRADGDRIHVRIDHDPVAACMASQYAGWQISVDKYFAMGSGPMRAAAGREALFDDIGRRETTDAAVGVLETAAAPTVDVVHYLAGKCNVDAAALTLAFAPTASIAGGAQIVARSVETALHKLHELDFNLDRIVKGEGSAPLPPVAKDDMTALGRTNDAVLYGADVTLHVTGDDASIETAGAQLPSSASSDYGRPFGEIFRQYDYDFYKIDPLLFSPARVTLINTDTGNQFTYGELNPDVLAKSFSDESGP